MPLSGFMAPVTLVGTLVQHTAETLSGRRHQPARRAGRAGPLRRLAGDLRHALRDDADGRRRDDDDRLRLLRDRQAPRPADPGLHRAERRQAARRPGRAGDRHGRHARGALPASTASPAPACSTSRAARASRSWSSTTRSAAWRCAWCAGIEPRDDFPSPAAVRGAAARAAPAHRRPHPAPPADRDRFPGPVIDRANRCPLARGGRPDPRPAGAAARSNACWPPGSRRRRPPAPRRSSRR